MNLAAAIASAQGIDALYRGAIRPNVVARETDTQALVLKQPDGRFAIVFPGTASLHDALTDVEIGKETWGGGKVHHGFLKAYDSVHQGILALLPPGASLVISGHSLGGALATLCADLLDEMYHVADVITFGSPRVGNGAFARDYNARLSPATVRLVNAEDPIPHMPWCFGTYRHVNTQHYLTNDGHLRVDQPVVTAMDELVSTLDVRMDRSGGLQHFSLAPAHHITSYLAKLRALT